MAWHDQSECIGMPDRQSSGRKGRSVKPRAHRSRDSQWRFGLRKVANAFKFRHLGVRQGCSCFLEDMASRHRIVKPPHEM
jgi:hypothetical protein